MQLLNIIKDVYIRIINFQYNFYVNFPCESCMQEVVTLSIEIQNKKLILFREHSKTFDDYTVVVAESRIYCCCDKNRIQYLKK